MTKFTDLAKFIDHTTLLPGTTRSEIELLCKEAKKLGFASVCVNPYWVELCHELLQDTDVNVCTVVGFPLGANTTETKVYEAKDAMKHGAVEIDMVINIGELKAGNDDAVKADIAAVVKACKKKALVKVIIETCLLTDDEKVRACQLAVDAGAEFVKTSTGFSTGGATPEDVKLMKDTVKDLAQVKASGGVRSKEDAMKMLEMGAARLGTSAGSKIVR
ncbi:deoxyribose-phosphate aldolase [Vagococcus penaei]|uniref:Deoxyribose-phosphate aldolase n=1 Tax=Vagococcus penaei TaxID=633807 RepID=A0A1Q2D8Q0_9ENTE|nr:deoxyribose-phosphate aldolase [Vagococcus penaei]AQP54613.1 deoxyribose-phosphate aldolase [Vagococcus penaei]RSU06674.1 deoxyribose-phosphate aldolase [Vagococcus penaei]